MSSILASSDAYILYKNTEREALLLMGEFNRYYDQVVDESGLRIAKNPDWALMVARNPNAYRVAKSLYNRINSVYHMTNAVYTRVEEARLATIKAADAVGAGTEDPEEVARWGKSIEEAKANMIELSQTLQLTAEGMPKVLENLYLIKKTWRDRLESLPSQEDPEVLVLNRAANGSEDPGEQTPLQNGEENNPSGGRRKKTRKMKKTKKTKRRRSTRK